MTNLADRAEQIAAHLVGHETGALVVPYDIDGRQAAVDFLLEWPDGRRGALEVTLITEPTSVAWQSMAAKEGWRWGTATSWEFRPTGANFQYKQTRRVVLRAVELCDKWSVDTPGDLPADVLAGDMELSNFLAEDIGSLRRTQLSPGVVLYPSTRAEFMDTAPSEFSVVVESWLGQSHMSSHIEKAMNAAHVSDKHLFLVPVDDVLPARFFTDDFETPKAAPKGFEELDALWIWSNYWHRYLVFRNQKWSWLDFPRPSRRHGCAPPVIHHARNLE